MNRSNQRRIHPDKKKQSHRRIFKRLGSALMMVLLFGATITSAIWLNQKWSITQWNIAADTPIKLAIEAKLAAMHNKDFISMRPDHLRQQWLQQMPDIESLSITRILPDRLHIQASARVPMALWQDEQGKLYLYDKLGVAYRPLHKGESPDLPLLRVNQDQLEQVQRMLQAIALQHPRQLADLSEIRAANQYWQIYFSKGISWMIPQNNEINVINTINTMMQQARWCNRQWRVDARLPSRWFIRPASHGGVI